jgi:hypothetical protein
MSDQLFNSAHAEVLLIFKRLDDCSSLGQNFGLDQSLVTISRVPFLTHRHWHQGVKLLGRLILTRELFDHVLLGEFLVALIVQLNSFHTPINSRFFKFFNFSFTSLFRFLDFLSMVGIVDTLTCPFTPALLNINFAYFSPKLVLNFVLFLQLEFLNCLVSISHKKWINNFLLICGWLVSFNQLSRLRVEIGQIILTKWDTCFL